MCSGRTLFSCFAALALPALAVAQSFAPLGTEYPVTGGAPGDQAQASVSLGANGGYVVWQDNAVDGTGLGIAAQKLDANFSGFYGSFRVNSQAAGNQSNPKVALLQNGGAAFVWQGGRLERQNIYLRFLNSAGTFTSQGDVRVNAYTNGTQTTPVAAGLLNGNAVVAWSSRNQDGSMEGVYARLMSPVGQNLGAGFLVNQTTAYSQRNPAVAVLTNGNFVVVWVSENQGLTTAQIGQGVTTAHIYGRVYNQQGQAQGNEFRIDSSTNVCASPCVAGTADGGFLVSWAERNPRPSSWDIVAQAYGETGTAAGEVFRVNSTQYGDQYAPQISGLGSNVMIVWTSMGQDGSWEGVYARQIASGEPVGAEFLVNTTTVRRQVSPAVSSDGLGKFLVVWSSFGSAGFDLFAQRYSSGQTQPQPFAPFVTSLSQSNLLVSWPEPSGLPVSGYLVYKDNAVTPTATGTTPYLKVSGLAAATAYSFRLAYQFSNGQTSAPSAPGSGTTWGPDDNLDDLPDDWQLRYWPNVLASFWPAAAVDSDGDGATNLAEFLAGTDPTDPNSSLKVRMSMAGGQKRLTWKTEGGSVYQVQVSSNLGGWSNYGSPRFAVGATDSVVLGPGAGAAYYRVVRVR